MFTKNILEGKPVDIFNRGNQRREFTYIDDVVDGTLRVLDKPASPYPGWSGDPANSRAPCRVYNIGNHRPVELLRYFELIERTVRPNRLTGPGASGGR